MTQTFAGSVALVTGAARGIGAGVARGIVAGGGKVALVGLEPALLAELATGWATAPPGGRPTSATQLP
ncbi:SDR family NAD(P)-dependent oxidoreductase [Aeromicrobium sp. UC242_57]|uniref:SDR family NAD(P)-dependent oxidoreductase n=1 Tax=Aeromicrobium sp. UC242_57 TaxID=3374624 RepID=UPI0037AF0CE3